MIKTLHAWSAKMIIRSMHGNLLDEKSPSEGDFWPKIHKYRAIPSREIALFIEKAYSEQA